MYAGRKFTGINLLYQNASSGIPTASDLQDWKDTYDLDEPVVGAIDREWIDPIWGSDGQGAAAGMVLIAPGMIIEKLSYTWGPAISPEEVEPLIPD